MPELNPHESDAVLGGQNTAPVNAAILGGLAGAKQRLESESIVAKIKALKDAIQYGTDGVNLALQALADPNDDIKRFVRRLLRSQAGEEGKAALLDREPLSYFTTLSDWRWEIYNPEVGIIDPENNAYVVQMTVKLEYEERTANFNPFQYHQSEIIYDLSQFEYLIKDPKICQLQALIFQINDEFENGDEQSMFEMALVAINNARDLLPNLQGLFIGASKENWPTGYRRSKLSVSDIRPFLESFPDLEILQVFGRFSDDEYQDEGYTSLDCAGLRHENLKTLIIETAYLAESNLDQIGGIELPNLEYFELWLGKLDIARSRISTALAPILYDNASPNLKYLGLCSDEDTDSLIAEILPSSIIDRLAVLDFKMGTMTSKGADYLLNSPDLSNLKYLDVFGNYLPEDAILKLQQLPCSVNTSNPQNPEHALEHYRIFGKCPGDNSRRWTLHE
jgi:hypothetical protein